MVVSDNKTNEWNTLLSVVTSQAEQCVKDNEEKIKEILRTLSLMFNRNQKTQEKIQDHFQGQINQLEEIRKQFKDVSENHPDRARDVTVNL